MSQDKASGVNYFLREAGRYPLLTAEQELLLSKQVQTWIAIRGLDFLTPEQRKAVKIGRRAYEKMFTSNMRLVVNVARKSYNCQHLGLEDLIQEGCIGLGRAIERFDPTRGYRFSTYAYWWLRQAINRAVAQAERTIRLPVSCIHLQAKLKVWIPQFAHDNGRMPTISELSDEFGVTTAMIEASLLHMQAAKSLDGIATHQLDDGGSLLDLIPDNSSLPMDELIKAEEIEITQKLLSSVSPIHSDVIQLRFDFGEKKTPADRQKVAARLGLTVGALGSLQDRALQRLRKNAQRMIA